MTPAQQPTTIYKILTPSEWDILCAEMTSLGSALDQADGFIHFSTHAQLQGTLDRHYQGAGQLILAEVPLSALDGTDVRWEPARDGSRFPHLYGPLAHAVIARHWPLHPTAEGGYVVPDLSRQS